MNRCPTCGASYPDDENFCRRDGTRLGSPPPSHAAAKPPKAGADLTDKVLDGRYHVERKVGEGGMSLVYLATDVHTGEPCAIKVLAAPLSRDANAMARLQREARLGMRLAHPNVCHIIRLGGTEDGLMYVVMPFLNGEVLAERTNRRGYLPLDETARLVHDVAVGLHVAHELAIVHRDLKPENVMVCTRPDGSDFAVVMDFGLAKERQAGPELQMLTATGIILGTPEFMSPEQLRGKPFDARTDIYSLALMTYEMLTGKLPFSGRTQQELMIARLHTGPTPLRDLRRDLEFPDAVERVLAKATQTNPDDRYPTTIEFADALSAAVAAGGHGAVANRSSAGGGDLGRTLAR
ncbi:MAG TPA: serine/threonine-protein kinase [Gemmatimonadaceae bacterium]